MALAARQEQDYLGSAAYDIFSAQAARPIPAYEPLPEDVPQAMPHTRVRRENHLFTALCVVGAICILFLVIFAHQRLYEGTMTNARLEAELAALQEEQVILRSTYDKAVNLQGVEMAAVTQFNMGRPAAGQTVYLDLGGEDRAEVLQKKTTNVFTELADFVGEAFSALGTYLTMN